MLRGSGCGVAGLAEVIMSSLAELAESTCVYDGWARWKWNKNRPMVAFSDLIFYFLVFVWLGLAGFVFVCSSIFCVLFFF